MCFAITRHCSAAREIFLLALTSDPPQQPLILQHLEGGLGGDLRRKSRWSQRQEWLQCQHMSVEAYLVCTPSSRAAIAGPIKVEANVWQPSQRSPMLGQHNRVEAHDARARPSCCHRGSCSCHRGSKNSSLSKNGYGLLLDYPC